MQNPNEILEMFDWFNFAEMGENLPKAMQNFCCQYCQHIIN